MVSSCSDEANQLIMLNQSWPTPTYRQTSRNIHEYRPSLTNLPKHAKTNTHSEVRIYSTPRTLMIFDINLRSQSSVCPPSHWYHQSNLILCSIPCLLFSAVSQCSHESVWQSKQECSGNQPYNPRMLDLFSIFLDWKRLLPPLLDLLDMTPAYLAWNWVGRRRC